jgi:hypothetical protein
VLSGINLGPNLGNGIWHSGTVAAAKQAALMGMPGIALSIPVVKDEPNFDALWRNAGKIEEARGVRRMPESLVPCGFLRLANPGFLVSCLPRRTLACGTRMAHDEARRAG